MTALLGIYGGTFDPVHNGHISVVRELLEEFNFSEIKLIPCKLPVHKGPAHASSEQRCAMLELVCREIPKVAIDKRELERSSPSYMLETLQSIRQDFPGQSIALIIGADSLINLHTWFQWKQLIDYAHIIVVARPNYDFAWNNETKKFMQKFETKDKSELYNRKFGSLFFSFIQTVNVSSSELREKIQNHERVDYLIPEKVKEYIFQEKLYLNT